MNYTSKEVYEYISHQTNDPIVERKICTVSGQEFPIYQSDLDFYAKISPTFAGQKFQIPTPTLCPEERQRRRLVFRNERKLYKRKCDATGENIVSMYADDNIHKIYNQTFRWSDKRDPFSYGQSFDFSKTFAEQFKELLLKVPRCNLLNEYTTLENSLYVNLAGPSKDCYMIIETDRCRDCYYGYAIFDCNSCVDCNNINFSELCYGSVDIKNSYKLLYCSSCYECKECTICFDCTNLTNCFGCRNKTGGQYMIYNKQYTKEEYETYLSQLLKQDLKKIFTDIQQQVIYKNMYSINNSGKFAGDHVTNSEDILFSFDVDNCRQCKYTTIIHDSNDCMDYISRGLNSSMIYEAHNSGLNLTNSAFVSFVRNNCDHIYYSDLCPINNSHLFGCVGLRNKSYCIFNKQYTKEEYEILVAKIIIHMQKTGERGEFFHPSLSPFSYNETIANIYYPVDKSQASVLGYARQDKDYQINIPDNMERIETHLLPFSIEEVDDSILNKAIICEVSGRPFRLQKAELEFYRKHKLPIPRKHPDVRHEERMKIRPGRTLYLRTCDKCKKEILSVYPVIARPEGSPLGGRDEAIHNSQDMDRHAIARDDSQKVYCESCYQKEVYA